MVLVARPRTPTPTTLEPTLSGQLGHGPVRRICSDPLGHGVGEVLGACLPDASSWTFELLRSKLKPARKLTAYYRPEDMDLDRQAIATGKVRFCGTNTGQDLPVNSGGDNHWGEVYCITDGTFAQAADTFVRDLTWSVGTNTLSATNQRAGAGVFTITLTRQ